MTASTAREIGNRFGPRSDFAPSSRGVDALRAVVRGVAAARSRLPGTTIEAVRGWRSVCKMTLGELLEGIAIREELPSAAAELSVTGLDYDSRRVEKGFVFFAFVGARVDGRRFALQALEQGAFAPW